MRIINLLIICILLLTVGCVKKEKIPQIKEKIKEEEVEEMKEVPLKSDLEGRVVLMIIASTKFRDEEYQEPRKILEDLKARIVVASSKLDVVTGMLGLKVKPDILLSDVKVEDYDAIIFVGGQGADEYWHDTTAHKICQEAIRQNKILAAICIAPVTLANAGVLKGKKATVFFSEIGKLKKMEAEYTGNDVEVDGNIITASGPAAAAAFGKAIAEALKK